MGIQDQWRVWWERFGHILCQVFQSYEIHSRLMQGYDKAFGRVPEKKLKTQAENKLLELSFYVG